MVYWTAIAGKFLLGQNSTYKAGTSGGSSSRTLTVDNIPAHTHMLGNRFVMWDAGASYAINSATDWKGELEYAPYNSDFYKTSSVGSGKSFSIMPPYLSVYIWQRTG